MPQTTLLVFKNAAGECPLLDWLTDLESTKPKAFVVCLERILQMEQSGYELRRPAAAHLGDGIYELRAKRGRVHYRILYFFIASCRNTAGMTHGFTKEGAVPDAEIKRAKQARDLVSKDMDRYTAEWDL